MGSSEHVRVKGKGNSRSLCLLYLFDFYHSTGGPSREFGGQKFGMRIAECGIKIRGSTMNDEFVKNLLERHPGESRGPEYLEITGFLFSQERRHSVLRLFP
jgi:hypothetical protein